MSTPTQPPPRNVRPPPPSTQYLGIDPQRIMVNRQARTAYEAQAAKIQAQQEQTRIDAEARQKAQEEADRQDAEIRAANARAGADPLAISNLNKIYGTSAPQPVKDNLPSDADIFKAIQASNPNINLNSLDIRYDANGNITSIGGNAYDPKLYNQLALTGKLTDAKQAMIPLTGNVKDNTITLTTGLAPLQEQILNEQAKQQTNLPAVQSEREIINNLAGAAQFAGSKTNFGYSISKDAQGNITGYNSSLFFPESVKVSPEAERLGYSIFKQNQIVTAKNQSAPSAYRLMKGDYNDLRNAGIDVRTISTPVKSAAAPAGDIQGPPNPFAETKPADENIPVYSGVPPPFEIKGDFGENFKNYFENIPLGVAGLGANLMHKEAPETHPEIEGQVYSELLGLAKRGYEGSPAILNLLLFSKGMGEIGQAIQKNPWGAAGSIAGSVLFTAATLGAGKAANAVKAANEFFGLSSKAAKVGTQAAKEITGIEDVTTQAIKLSKTGQEIPLSQVGPLYTRTKQITVPTLFRSSVKGLPETTAPLKFPVEFSPGTVKVNIKVPATPDIFRISKDAEDLGVFSLKTGRGQVFQSGLTQAEKEALVTGTETAKAPATAITDVYQNEAGVLPRVSVPVVAGAIEKTPGSIIVQADRFSGKVAESRFTGANLVEFSTKQMIQDAELAARRNAQISAASAALMEISGKNKPFTPLDFGPKVTPKITQGSRTALQTVNEYSFDKELSKFATQSVTQAEAAATSSGRALGLYGGASTFKNVSSLGFGGKTGQPSKVTDADVYDQIVNTGPTSTTKTTTKNQLVNTPQSVNTNVDQFIRDLTGQGNKQDNFLGTRNFFNLATNPKQGTTQTPGLDLINIPKTDTTPITTPLTTPLVTPITTPLTTPLTVPVQTPKTPKERQVRPPPFMFSTKARKGKKGNPYAIYYGETLWKVPNIFIVNEKALRELGLIGNIGKSRRK